MTMTMKSKAPTAEDELKQIASFGKPENYEWALIEQYGARVKIIYRNKTKTQPTAPQASEQQS